MIMAARFEPRFLKDRSPAAATEYLRRFRRRHKLSIRRITHRGTKQRSDLEVVAASFGHSMRYAFEHDSAVSFVAGDEKYGQVFNMDQTSIYIDMNPTTTITFRGDRNVDVLQATGAKLCPLIVFSGTPGGPIEEELHAHPLYSKEVFLAVQKKGYCDERAMHIWINEVWRPSVTSSRVLLLDSLKTHKMSSVRTELEDSLSTEVEFIPPGITGLSQPIDERVMHIWINEVWRPSVTSSRVLLLDSLKTHKMSSVRTELEDSLSTEVEFIPPGITGLSQPIDERVMHIWINEVWRPSVTSSRTAVKNYLS
ncbi:hypothetical protein PF005_g11550 [Phytophthora fragariae]|uniref:DDE-1 domain-containing protein n=1 Tax=Phytophthora fragariae TaxID=53985 RepID=A0A6A3Y1S1_9STRA|nr:hypothetical protein PF005_g11550 [Phytophthora fragariae]